MTTVATHRQLEWRKVLLAFGWLVGFLVLFFGYLYLSQLVSKNSDDASIIFEGQAMLHGNLLMRGWYLPPDSFITTDMPLDTLGSLFFTGQQLLNITPAFLYAATVIGATYLAIQQAPHPGRRWIAAAACLALLAFPIGLLFTFVMQSPVHMGTIVATLIAWLAYNSFVKHPTCFGMLGLFVLVATLAVIGDPMAELLIVVPVGIVSTWVLWRARGRDRTALVTLGSVLLVLLVGIGVRQILIISGTFIGQATLSLGTPESIWLEVQWLIVGIYQTFHIDIQPSATFGELLFLLLNAGFLVICCLGFIRLLPQLLIPKDMQQSLTSVLSWAILGSIAAYLFTNFSVDISGLRYLIPALVYAGILCYSAFARVVPRSRLTPVILAFLAVSVLTYGVALAQFPRTGVPEQQLITFLEDHDLTLGFGSYWAANITTLMSNEHIRVLPVFEQAGQIRAYRFHASAAWFQARQLANARFVVIDGTVSVAPFQEAVIHAFGPPDHIYRLTRNATFIIFAWDHSILGPADKVHLVLSPYQPSPFKLAFQLPVQEFSLLWWRKSGAETVARR